MQRLRRNRPVLDYAVGNGVSAVGTWMQRVAMGWLAWESTQSAAWVAAMSLGDLISGVLVAPWAGIATDGRNAYQLMRRVQLLCALQGVTVCILAATSRITIIGLLLLSVLLSIIEGLNQPSRMSVVSRLASRERLSQAVAANSMAFNLARSIGPALAAVAIIHVHVAVVFACDAASYLFFWHTLGRLRPLIDVPGESHTDLPRDALSGVRFVRATPSLTVMFLYVISLSVLARPFAELYPAFAGRMQNGGPGTLAALTASQGLGALVGACWMLRGTPTPHLFRVTFRMALGLCASVILFTSSRSIMVAVPALLIAGFCHVSCTIGSQSLVQLITAPAYRGRVLALYGAIFRAAPPLGAFIIGLLATRWSLALLVGLAAAISALPLIWLMSGPWKSIGPLSAQLDPVRN